MNLLVPFFLLKISYQTDLNQTVPDRLNSEHDHQHHIYQKYLYFGKKKKKKGKGKGKNEPLI